MLAQIEITCCMHQTQAAQQQLPKNITSTTPPTKFHKNIYAYTWQWHPTQDDGKSNVIHRGLFSEVTLKVGYARVVPGLT